MIDRPTSVLHRPCQGGSAPRYAFVFAPSERNLLAALAFVGTPDHVWVETDIWEHGTTAATIRQLQRLLATEPTADVLVVVPEVRRRSVVYVGPAEALAERVRRRAPAWWFALSGPCVDGADGLSDLPPSDLARDVLDPA